MVLNFDALNLGKTEKQTDPRKIFSTLIRNEKFKRPLDEQSDVLDEWYKRRNSKDLLIKMNTGAGKTIIGLLCLQSSLNEGIKPAVYVTADNFLTEQVYKEAKDLGINVTLDKDNKDFLSGNSILIINTFKLFNGLSVFGIDKTNIEIGSIVIDDAHACLDVITKQFCITSTKPNAIYNTLLNKFENSLKKQSANAFYNLQQEDPTTFMIVPYWDWQSEEEDITKLLYENRNHDELKWQWPLINQHLSQCVCIFGRGTVEISPHYIPIHHISSFEKAKRRIYMTATLADDTILFTHFNAKLEDIKEPIKPKGGGDIGDRMILIPQEINPNYTFNDIKNLVYDISKTRNVVVIIPSRYKLKDWIPAPVTNQVLDHKNIQEGITNLKKGYFGLTILINKYDGIDLPKKACELLIIDELPEISSLKENLEMNWLDNNERLLSRQIQRIEQGMGRGVRSSDDYCGIILQGRRLTERLHKDKAKHMFSPATYAQIQLGQQVIKQIQNQPIEQLLNVLNLCFERNTNWVTTGRNVILNISNQNNDNVKSANQIEIYLRQAYNFLQKNRLDLAKETLQKAVNEETIDSFKGFLIQQLAEYTNFTDPLNAQELQLKARELNYLLLTPEKGIQYNKHLVFQNSQVENATLFLTNNFKNSNSLIIWIQALLEDLSLGKKGTKKFEKAIHQLGLFLGFSSSRPEENTGGPDNLWAIGNLQYFVIECKSGVETYNHICKHDINQLTGSMEWFRINYDETCSAKPIMIHPSNQYDSTASPHKDMRVIDTNNLEKLKKNINFYSLSLKDVVWDRKNINKRLLQYNFLSNQIQKIYTIEPTKQKN